MISLEQIRTLESKVHKTVERLSSMQEENQLLKGRLSAYEKRIEELEFLIEEFKEEQSEIEQGIISALQHLDSLEDAVGGLKPTPSGGQPPSIEQQPHHIAEVTPPIQQSWQAEEEVTVVEDTTWDRTETASSESAGDAESGEPSDEYAEDDPEAKDTRQLDIF